MTAAEAHALTQQIRAARAQFRAELLASGLSQTAADMVIASMIERTGTSRDGGARLAKVGSARWGT